MSGAAGTLLYLVHRIPYPPNKGDKIRSWHLLRHLAARHRVLLGALVDDPDDLRHAARLAALCAEVELVPISPRLRKLGSLAALATGEAQSVRYFHHARLQRWVDAMLARHRPTTVVAFSSPMARYLPQPLPGVRRVVDMVDVDSDKWRQYAAAQPWPASWLYRREAARLFAWEQRVAAAWDATVFVSEAEAASFRAMAPAAAARVHAVANGVDATYFAPGGHAAPLDEVPPALVFTGAMDYYANEHAVEWFAREVLPEVRRAVPEAAFWIVGARPTRAVQALAALPGVHVTGAVPDVRPWLAHARAAVAPLRIARGLQNKVLEAMAMGRPVLATPQAMEGIEVPPVLAAWVAADAAGLAARAIRLLREGDAGAGEAGRALVTAHHAWEAHLARFDALLAGAGS